MSNKEMDNPAKHKVDRLHKDHIIRERENDELVVIYMEFIINKNIVVSFYLRNNSA